MSYPDDETLTDDMEIGIGFCPNPLLRCRLCGAQFRPERLKPGKPPELCSPECKRASKNAKRRANRKAGMTLSEYVKSRLPKVKE